MGTFKKIFEENIMFTKKGEHKYKPVLDLSKSDAVVTITYVDGKVKKNLTLNEKNIEEYSFILRTKNLFYKKYNTVDPKTLFNEMTTGDAGVGATSDSQFSGDTYAPDDARNLFGGKAPDFPITRRPKITDTVTGKQKKKKMKAKKKKTSGKKQKK